MKIRKKGIWYIPDELTEADLIEISKKDMDLYKVLIRSIGKEIEPTVKPIVEIKKKKYKK